MVSRCVSTLAPERSTDLCSFIRSGNVIREISEHSHYVQGIAWDPLNDFIATQSSDRSVHVHSLHSKAFGDSSHSSGIGTISTVSRNSRMDLHRRTGSGSFVWDHNAKPPMQRRGSSHASHASDSGQERERETPSQGGRPRTGRSITPFDPQGSSHSALSTQDTPTASGSGSGSGAAQQPPTPTALHHSARAVTPTPGPSVPQSPFSSASASASAHAMNPPQTTPSRRSSFSGSNADCASPPANHSTLSAHSFSAHHGPTRTSSRTRTGRSPSPVPPLPAIRALPSPKHRARAQTPGAAGTGQSQGQGQALTKSSLRLYGDENFSGFFRRLTFSPDGALLVTPGGVFDAPPLPASPTVSVRAVRNASEPSTDPGTPSCSTPTPTSKSVSSLAPYQAHSASAAASSNTGPRSTVYIYARGNLHRSDAPVAHLPGHKTASIVVKFSPILYELRPGSSGAGGSSAGSGAGSTLAPHPTVPLEVGKQKSVTLYQAGTSVANASANASAGASANPASSSALDDSDDPELPPAGSAGAWAGASARRSAAGTSVFGLPYRMVYAVATQDSVWIYDTQQSGPLCCFSNMHYASFTDLAW